MQVKSFHVGDILSVTTGTLVSPTHVAGVVSLLDFMTGVGLFTHQIPRALDVCAPFLREQLPALAAFTLPEIKGEGAIWRFLAYAVEEVGKFHYVATLPPGIYRPMHPLREFREIAPGKPVIAVAT